MTDPTPDWKLTELDKEINSHIAELEQSISQGEWTVVDMRRQEKFRNEAIAQSVLVNYGFENVLDAFMLVMGSLREPHLILNPAELRDAVKEAEKHINIALSKKQRRKT